MPTQADSAPTLDMLQAYDFFPFATFVPGRTNGSGGRGRDFRRHKTLAQARTSIKGIFVIYGRTNPTAQTVYDQSKLYGWNETDKSGTGEWVELDIKTGKPVE